MDSLTFLKLMNVGITVFFFAIGSIIASFWALVAARLQEGRGWVKGRSECDYCRHLIHWWQNIPVLSYLLLRGRCHYCHRRIKASYFIWECLLGLWTVVWLWYLSPLAPYADQTSLAIRPPFFSVPGNLLALLQSLLFLCLGAVLLWTALVDLQTQEIADGWLWTVLALTVAKYGLDLGYGSLSLGQIGPVLLRSLGVGAVFWVLDWVARRIWKRPGIGLGDTLMVMLLAWWLPSVGELAVMFLLAFWLGAIVGLLILGFAKLGHVKKQPTIAFLPFINLAFLLSCFWGQQLSAWLLGLNG